MLLRTWRLLTILLIALSLAPALCHLLEMPAKLTFDGPLWLTLQQRLYHAFGAVTGWCEIGAVITAWTLVFLARHRRPAVGWTLAGALCMAAAHAAFWIWVQPVNAALAPLTAETLPADWTQLRSQWEYTHGARAILQIVALATVAWSVVLEGRD